MTDPKPKSRRDRTDDEAGTPRPSSTPSVISTGAVPQGGRSGDICHALHGVRGWKISPLRAFGTPVEMTGNAAPDLR